MLKTHVSSPVKEKRKRKPEPETSLWLWCSKKKKIKKGRDVPRALVVEMFLSSPVM
jgi:hypothetical protein